jgi:hypothetical protein
VWENTEVDGNSAALQVPSNARVWEAGVSMFRFQETRRVHAKAKSCVCAI